MLPKNQRISKKDNFKEIFKKSSVFKAPYLKLFISNNSFGNFKTTVIVSKKVSNLATTRNKIKRKIRHILISAKENIPKNTTILIQVNDLKILEKKSSEIEKVITDIFKK